MSDTDTTKNTQTVECLAGHMWERRRNGKKPPKYCPEHKNFLQGPISVGSQPKARVINEWEDAEKNLVTERGYAARWLKFWRDNVRIVAARKGTWSGVDIKKFEAFVRHSRLAELHRLFAQDNPYYTTTNGSVRSHPGWKNERLEQKKADALAVELGLKVEPAKNGTGAQVHSPSKLEQEADAFGGIVDDQVGPDGQPL